MPIPTSVKIGETEYKLADYPELMSIVTETRKEEKDKLNTRLETHRRAEDALAEQVANEKITGAEARKRAEKLDEELKSLKAKAKELEDDKGDKGGTPPKHKKDDSDDTDERMQSIVEKAIAKVKADSDTKIAELEKQLGTKVSGDYRDELLEKYKGQIIPDLLTGNSKDELDKSLEKTLEVSKKYLTVEVEGKTMTLQQKADADQKTADDKEAADKRKNEFRTPNTPDSRDLTDGVDLLENVKDMTEAQYAKHRDEIMLAARQTAKTAMSAAG